jgi:phospholipase/carboxylesterase
MSDTLVVQRPAQAAQQLILLFHGVGGHPREMLGLGKRLGAEFPSAMIVSVAAPYPAERGAGRQWFSVQGLSEDNRAARVQEAMPAFVEAVRHWQRESGIGIPATALVGFSQGAIMALESTRHGAYLAGRVAAIAGRFARLPVQATPQTTLHLIHGKTDDVIAYGHTLAAAERVVELGGDVTADVLPFVGHEINGTVENLLVERLRGYIPRRLWEEALRADPEAAPAPGSCTVNRRLH